MTQAQVGARARVAAAVAAMMLLAAACDHSSPAEQRAQRELYDALQRAPVLHLHVPGGRRITFVTSPGSPASDPNTAPTAAVVVWRVPGPTPAVWRAVVHDAYAKGVTRMSIKCVTPASCTGSGGVQLARNLGEVTIDMDNTGGGEVALRVSSGPAVLDHR